MEARCHAAERTRRPSRSGVSVQELRNHLNDSLLDSTASSRRGGLRPCEFRQQRLTSRRCLSLTRQASGSDDVRIGIFFSLAYLLVLVPEHVTHMDGQFYGLVLSAVDAMLR